MSRHVECEAKGQRGVPEPQRAEITRRRAQLLLHFEVAATDLDGHGDEHRAGIVTTKSVLENATAISLGRSAARSPGPGIVLKISGLMGVEVAKVVSDNRLMLRCSNR